MILRTSSKKKHSGDSKRRDTLHSIESRASGKDKSRRPKSPNQSLIPIAAHTSPSNGTTSPALTTRCAGLADLEVLVKLNQLLAREKYSKRLRPAALRAGILAQLGDSGSHGRYFVAERAGEVVGQVRVWTEYFDWECAIAQAWWFDSCVSLYRRQGIFRVLFQHILTLAVTTPGVVKLRLHVEEHNLEAIKTYIALGFIAGNLMMEMPVTRR